MKFIGLGHYSRTGKDTVANAMIEWFAQFKPELTVKKMSLAWKLKQICHDLYAWAGVREPEFYDTTEGEKHRDIVLPLLGMTPVELWVKFGTDAVRENVYLDTWLDYVFESEHPADIVIVPDIRFPNEHRKAREKNIKLVKVVRPGYGPRKTKADRALLGCTDWDYVIGASGEISDLRKWAARFAGALVTEMLIEAGFEPMARWPEQSAEEKAAASNVEVIEPCEHDPVPGPPPPPRPLRWIEVA